MIDALVNSPWTGAAIWALLYIGDYGLTIAGARLYRRGAHRFFAFEQGYELNPVFKRDIARLRYFSPRFIMLLLTTTVLILIIWRLSRPYPQLFIFLIGALVLIEVSVHMRHLRNIVLFWIVLHRGGVEGHISYAGWLSYRVSAMEFFTYALLFLVVWLLTRSIFFLGGASTCLVTGIKHIVFSRKLARHRSVPSPDTAAEREGSGENGLQSREES